MNVSEPKNEVKIRAEHVDFSYENTQTLFDINLEFRNHEVTALIGPSGCGKSTFLRTLSRMNELICDTTLKGKILLDGEDIYAPNYDVVQLRQRVGMVFQKPTPFPKSIFENVAYGLRVAGISSRSILAEKVEESLRRAALWEEVKDRLNESALGLSGGQQQRLCIARALAVEPEVLLMDEPCSALDPIATQRVEESILELKQSLCIVIVTHNMQQAARVSDKTAFFFMGKLIEFDDTTRSSTTLPTPAPATTSTVVSVKRYVFFLATKKRPTRAAFLRLMFVTLTRLGLRLASPVPPCSSVSPQACRREFQCPPRYKL